MKNFRMEKTHHSLIHDGVAEHEQTLMPGRPFWVLFAANLGIGTWLMGVLVAKMGLDFANGMMVLLLGSLIGSILPAWTAIIGPLSQLSQMESGRLALGQAGKKVAAFLNWVGAVGWDVINNIISTSAVIILFGMVGIDIPFWLALAGLVISQTILGIYGHHLIQDASKYTGALLALFFVVIGLIATKQASAFSVQDKPANIKEILSALALITIYNTTGWTTFTADYTRYLPKKTKSRTVFFGIYLALFFSLLLLGFFGFMTASTVTEETPAGVMKGLQNLTGHFSPLVLLLVGFSAIPANAVNANSAAYSLISSGFRFSRPHAALFSGIVGYIVCLFASRSFVEFFENFLLLFAHWIVPWAAIILVHWYWVGRHNQKTPLGFTRGAVLLGVVSIGSILLFSSNALYTGPIAARLNGLDIGPYVGFIVAALTYLGLFVFFPEKNQ
ncbi:MAG: cytosine permease [Nitrospirae bacterium]|nr:cytosine permease [Nitrospirota bacterium]